MEIRVRKSQNRKRLFLRPSSPSSGFPLQFSKKQHNRRRKFGTKKKRRERKKKFKWIEFGCVRMYCFPLISFMVVFFGLPQFSTYISADVCWSVKGVENLKMLESSYRAEIQFGIGSACRLTEVIFGEGVAQLLCVFRFSNNGFMWKGMIF